MTHGQADISGAFNLHRAHTWLSLGVISGVGALFFVVGLFMPDLVWRVVLMVWGGMFVLAGMHASHILRDKGPVLSVRPDGLITTPFSKQVVPWSEITEMARLTYYNQSVWMGRVKWHRMPGHDLLYFSVADPTRYPNDIGRTITRAMQRFSGLPPIGIQLYFVDADPDTIVAEIRKYWKGQIREIDPRPTHLIPDGG
jgi:hypothetical protein